MSDQHRADPAFRRWGFYLLKPIHRLLMWIYFRVEIVGEHHLPSGGAILAPKHSSRWDPLLVALLSPVPLRFVATHTEFCGMQGWFMRQLGAIPVHRENFHASTFHQVESLLLAGEQVVMFPEGGIRPGRVGALKPGICRLGVRLASRHHRLVPIVPVALSYTPAPQFRAQVRIEVLSPLLPEVQIATQPPRDKQMAQVLTQQLSQTLSEALTLPVEV